MSKQNRYQKVKILNIEFDLLTPSESIDYMADYLESAKKESIYVVKPYVEFMTAAHDDGELANILNTAELCLADGVSLQWAASYLYGQPKSSKNFLVLAKSLLVDLQKPAWRQQIISERGAGVDVTARLFKRAEKEGWRIGIINGRPDKTTQTTQNIRSIFPQLKLINVWPGYFSASKEKNIIDEVKKAKLDLLFVARGFPIQEKFIYRYRDHGLARILIGEGGSFDYDQLGGPIRRAPKVWRQLGLEWLWRLFRQPKRFGRMMAIPRFIYLVQYTAKDQQ